MSASFSKRSNPLFGFLELQSSMLNSIEQEQIDLNKEYDIETMETNFCIATRKDTQQKVFLKRFGKLLNDWKHFKNEVETLKHLNYQCIITINRAMYDDHFYYIEMPFLSN